MGLRKKILILDSIFEIHEMLELHLKYKYELKHSVNGKDALELVDSFYPDLIVCAGTICPEMNGHEFCKAARSKGYNGVFIYFSTDKRESTRELAYESGADLVAEKLNFKNFCNEIIPMVFKDNYQGGSKRKVMESHKEVPFCEKQNLSEEIKLELYREGIRRFLRSSRKAGIATLVFNNCGSNSNEDFAKRAASYFSVGEDEDSGERLFWESLILENVSCGAIYSIERVRELLSEKEWDGISIKGVPEDYNRLRDRFNKL